MDIELKNIAVSELVENYQDNQEEVEEEEDE